MALGHDLGHNLAGVGQAEIGPWVGAADEFFGLGRVEVANGQGFDVDEIDSAILVPHRLTLTIRPVLLQSGCYLGLRIGLKQLP